MLIAPSRPMNGGGSQPSRRPKALHTWRENRPEPNGEPVGENATFRWGKPHTETGQAPVGETPTTDSVGKPHYSRYLGWSLSGHKHSKWDCLQPLPGSRPRRPQRRRGREPGWESQGEGACVATPSASASSKGGAEGEGFVSPQKTQTPKRMKRMKRSIHCEDGLMCLSGGYGIPGTDDEIAACRSQFGARGGSKRRRPMGPNRARRAGRAAWAYPRHHQSSVMEPCECPFWTLTSWGHCLSHT